MAWSEFYMDVGSGSNLNAGSTSGGAVYTSTAGNWDGTSVFTPTDGQTTTSLVAVNDWASIYPTGNSTTPYVAQVTVVGSGVNGTITLSTTAKFGTAPTSGTGTRVCKTGGAWADLGMTASGVALTTGTVAQSTRINIKAGTYANTTTTRTLALAGTTTTPIWWRGYKTTIGDQDANNVAVAGTDIPLITFTTGQLVVSGAYQTFSSLAMTSQCTTTNGAIDAHAASLEFYRFRCENTAANAAAKVMNQFSAAAGLRLISSWFKATSSAPVITSNASVAMHAFGSQFVGGTTGLTLNGTGDSVLFCVFDSQGSDAIQTNAATIIVGNSIYAPGGNGINITVPVAGLQIIANNYFENVNVAAKAAINNTSGTNTNLVVAIGNAYYNCTGNTSGFGDSPLIFDNGTLGSAGFVAPLSQNFALNPVAKALGYPGKFENTAVYQGYLDPGAVQRVEPAAGGGIMINPGMSGGLR